MFSLKVKELRFFTDDIFEISLERMEYDADCGLSLEQGSRDGCDTYRRRPACNSKIPGRKYEFVPGQCAVIFDEHDDSRPYSISSGAEEPVLRFLLRRFTGGALSNWLAERKAGDEVRVSLPFGEFRTAEGKGAVVFIASGVGISPFLSALRSRCFEPEKVVCLYGVRTLEDAVPVPTLRNRVDLQLAVSREEADGHFHGRVTGLLETLTLPDEADVYLCGCDAMIDNVYDLLRVRNIPASRIHTEVFFSSEKK